VSVFNSTFKIFFYPCGGVRLRPLNALPTSGPIVLAPDADEYGAIGGMTIGGGNICKGRYKVKLSLQLKSMSFYIMGIMLIKPLKYLYLFTLP
jgi:hypothetical protein